MAKPDVEDGNGPPDFFDTERFRALVKSAGGPAAVARRAGMHIGSLNNYLAGREMKVSVAAKLAAACNVSLDYFATGKERGLAMPDISLLQPETLDATANFAALLAVISTCQEYHFKMNLKPSLREVLVWIGDHYVRHRELPDRLIEIKFATWHD